MLSRFDTVPACDGRADRQTVGRTDVQPISITCFSIADARKNGKGTKIYIAPHRENLTPEALRYGSHHSFYSANTPYLPLPRRRSPDGATTDSDSSHLIAA